MTTRYLRQVGSGYPFVWTPELAQRPDMVEVTSLDAPMPLDATLEAALFGPAGDDEVPRVDTSEDPPAVVGGEDAPVVVGDVVFDKTAQL